MKHKHDLIIKSVELLVLSVWMETRGIHKKHSVLGRLIPWRVGTVTCFFFFFLFLINLFICFYIWLCWVFIAVRGLSLVEASRGYSSLQCVGFSLSWLLLLWSRALGVQAAVVVAHGLSSCGSQALEHRLSSCGTQA